MKERSNLDRMRTLSYAIVFLVVTVVAIIPAFLVACLPAKIRHACKPYYWLSHGVFWLMIKSWWVPVKFTGWHHIPQKPIIFAANHQSSLDIPLLGYVAQGRQHVWVLWWGLVVYPVFSFIMRRMNVVVDDRNPRKAVRALHEAGRLLGNEHLNLMIFPEGSRFNDGAVHKFFRGFAILAQDSGRPVVPVFIVNAGKVCPPRTFSIHYAPIHVIIGEPFYLREGESDQEFTKRVHMWFEQQNNLL